MYLASRFFLAVSITAIVAFLIVADLYALTGEFWSLVILSLATGGLSAGISAALHIASHRMPPEPRDRRPILNISARKVGGIRFLKLGRITLSFCLSQSFRPFAN